MTSEKILTTKPYLPDKTIFESYINKIWENNWLTNNGPLLKTFQQQLCEYFGSDHISLQTNGHLSLEMAIHALHLSGEIITTPFTFASTTHAITRCGATPVFCDIKSNDLTMDPDCIEELITEHTTAIIPVHVYGHPCDTASIERIAKVHNLKVIYDAAHAFGVKVDGIPLACHGDISMCSFHATKLFHTIEGGALIYKDKALTYEFDGLKNYGIRNETLVDMIGGNSKMSEFQAAMGLSILPHVAEIIAERKKITEIYRNKLSQLAGIHFFTPENEHVSYNFAYLPVLVNAKRFGKTRDELYDGLKGKNIFSRRYFYPLTCDFQCYQELCPAKEALPVSRRAASEILALPLYNGLSETSVNNICDAIYEIKAEK